MAAAVDLVKAVGGGWDASSLPSGDALRATTVSKNVPQNDHTAAVGASALR
jgi:hypothetical protein